MGGGGQTVVPQSIDSDTAEVIVLENSLIWSLEALFSDRLVG